MLGGIRRRGLVGLALLASVALSLNFAALAQSGASVPLPMEEMRGFADVYARIKSNYVEAVDDKKLFAEAISGMLAGLDPHSAYLDKEAYRELQIGTAGEFGGLGIDVGMEDGLIKVISAIDDSPASQAGIRSGDLIVKIGDALVKGMTLDNAVKRMRGRPDTPVTLTIARKGGNKPMVFALRRAVIKMQSVKSQLLEPGYAYFRITQFQGPTGETLANAVRTVFRQNQGPMKGLVVDLRNDPGGLLNGAVGVAALFLPKNALVVYTDGRTEDSKLRLVARPEDYLSSGAKDYLSALPPGIKDVPMVVLVDGGSASASEIVAGALQDHRRAVIMGRQTFGKASVQTIVPLGDGTAIKLTTARYYTPSGRSIQAKGIVPDIALEEAPRSAADLKLREADLGKHLLDERNPGTAAPRTANAFNFIPAARPQVPDEKDIKPEPGEVVARNDYELAQAIAFLKARRVLRASVN